MQTEGPDHSPVGPEKLPHSESGESKRSKRGGKRPEAGRKPNLAKRLLKGVSRDTITAAVQGILAKDDSASACHL